MSSCVHIDAWFRGDSLAVFFMAVPFWEKHPEILSGPGGTATLKFQQGSGRSRRIVRTQHRDASLFGSHAVTVNCEELVHGACDVRATLDSELDPRANLRGESRWRKGGGRQVDVRPPYAHPKPSVFPLKGEERVPIWYRQTKATKRGEMGDEESERVMVAAKWGNPSEGTLWSEGRAGTWNRERER